MRPPRACRGRSDWGSSFVWFGEKRVRTRFFALVLGFSRRMFSKGYKNERIVNLLAGHEAAFAWFGGTPREILYDNPKTMVKGRDPETEKVELNPTFRDFVRPLRIPAPVLPPLSGPHQGEDRVGDQVHQEELPGRQTIP